MFDQLLPDACVHVGNPANFLCMVIRHPIFNLLPRSVHLLSALLLCMSARVALAQDKSPVISVIQMHGTVGKIPGNRSGDPSFTAETLETALKKAKAMNPCAVVLDIDGPGGLVSEMRKMVDVLHKAQAVDGMRVVAMVRNAYSAWAIIALACKEIVVIPTSKMGAAVVIQSNGQGGFVEAPEEQGAVAQKFIAPWKALCRQVDDLTGRCQCIRDAMMIQDKELWGNPKSGFADAAGNGPGWKCIDNKVTVCCLTADEMLTYGLATEKIQDPVKGLDELPIALKCPPGSVVKKVTGPAVAAVPPAGKKVAEEAFQKAAGKLREASALAKQISFKAKIVTRTKSVSERGAVGYQQKKVSYKDHETAAEVKSRVGDILAKVKAKVPFTNPVASDPDFVNGINEIKRLLKEAEQHLKSDAPDAVLDRVGKACELMDGLAGQY